MRRNQLFILGLLLVLTGSSPLMAQKPVLDTSAINNWPRITGSGFSADGGSFFYVTGQGSREDAPKRLFVQVLNGPGKWEFKVSPGYVPACFADRGNKFFFKKSTDTAAILNLKTGETRYLPGCGDIETTAQAGNWIYYRRSQRPDVLVCRRLSDEKERLIGHVLNYKISRKRDQLLAVVKDSGSRDGKNLLVWFDLEKNARKEIYRAAKFSKIAFDRQGQGFAFLASDGVGEDLKLYSMEDNLKPAVLEYTEKDLIISDGLLEFSQDSRRIFVRLVKREPAAVPLKPVGQVWRWDDKAIGEGYAKSKVYFNAAARLDDHKIIRLQQENETQSLPLTGNDEWCVTTRGKWNLRELSRTQQPLPEYYLCSTRTGERIRIGTAADTIINPVISPVGRFAVWYSPNQREYIAFDIHKRKSLVLSAGLKTLWTTEEENDKPDSLYRTAGYASWDAAGRYVYVADQRDIWKFDLYGQQQPRNLTLGYSPDMQFQVLPLYKGIVPANGPVVLTGLNLHSKTTGFYAIYHEGKGLPRLLSSGGWALNWDDSFRSADGKVNAFVMMSENRYPNFVFSTDFKRFENLSNLQPQENYNWLKTELVSWKLPDGRMEQGVLYTPENLDKTKKYPVIFLYYERKSQLLHYFEHPGYPEAAINIPWFVSRGYTVFSPDIHYEIGHPMRSALQTVESATDHLIRQYLWVDSTKLGLNGHSWGGYQTNYIAARSRRFAAAVSLSGGADYISSYNYISHGGTPRHHFFETGQTRIGGTLWNRKDLFIENSAVFFADQATTPILLVHGKDDGSVPFAEGVEFFSALRRLGKPSWLVQYEEGHIFMEETIQKDLLEKQMSFFDYFLRDGKKPVWMK